MNRWRCHVPSATIQINSWKVTLRVGDDALTAIPSYLLKLACTHLARRRQKLRSFVEMTFLLARLPRFACPIMNKIPLDFLNSRIAMHRASNFAPAVCLHQVAPAVPPNNLLYFSWCQVKSILSSNIHVSVIPNPSLIQNPKPLSISNLLEFLLSIWNSFPFHFKSKVQTLKFRTNKYLSDFDSEN